MPSLGWNGLRGALLVEFGHGVLHVARLGLCRRQRIHCNNGSYNILVTTVEVEAEATVKVLVSGPKRCGLKSRFGQ